MAARDDAPARWRVIVHGPGSPAWNMAVDEALARAPLEDSAILRLYEWDRPTVSLGRNQPAAKRYDLQLAAREGIAFVRRPTGGRAVLHDVELTYSVAVAATAFGGPKAIYGRIQAALRAALVAVGLPAVQKSRAEARSPRPSVEPCFGTALPGEVTLAGRKVIGSAQARIDNRVLQHGAILVGNNQHLLDDLTLASSASANSMTLAEAGLTTTPAALAREVQGAFERVLPGEFAESQLTDRERQIVDELLPRYQSEEWTWRR